MKYSIRGTFTTAQQTNVQNTIQKYPLWKPLAENNYTDDSMVDWYWCEALLNAELDKTNLFEELKPFVTSAGESIDWHKCTHDENLSRPCVIEEIYHA